MRNFNVVGSRTFSSLSQLPPPPLPPTLVSTVVSILRHRRSKSRWNEICILYPAGFTPAEFSLITLSLRSNPHLALRFFQFTIRRSICDHSLSSYSTIIHTLARSRRLKPQTLTIIQSVLRQFPDQNPKIFETLVKTYRECDSAPLVFDLLIEACLRSKRIDQAIMITRSLRSRGISPSTSTCNSLIRSVLKCDGCFAGFDLYKEVLSGVCIVPNVRTYNEIMLSFYQDGFWENVKGVWEEMAKQGIEPNTYSYNILMAVNCEDGRMGEAMELWEEMGLKSLRYDAVAYNTMIGGYCKIGEVERAEEFFKEMELGGIEGSCITFEHLINGYCKIRDLDSALLLYNDMCRRGFRPEGSIVDAIVREFCGQKMGFEALEFFRAAMRKYKILPKKKSYDALIRSLCDEGRMEEALELQAEMVGKGFGPNLDIYRTFIEGFTKQGNDEMVRRLKKEMLDTQTVEEVD